MSVWNAACRCEYTSTSTVVRARCLLRRCTIQSCQCMYAEMYGVLLPMLLRVAAVCGMDVRRNV